MSSEAKDVGERIRAARKMRGFTVRKLADAAKISVPYLEKIEQGTRTPSSRIIIDLAKALRIGPDRLNGQPFLNGTESEDAISAVIPELRRIMLTYDSPDDLQVAPRTLDVLAAEMEQVSRLRQDGRYVPMGPRLPSLLTELTHLALSGAGQEQERAYWWLARGYRAANSLSHKLGYHDLSMTAIERVRWAAGHSGDPLMNVIAGYLLLGAMLRQGSWAPAQKLMVRLEVALDRVAAGSWDDESRGLLGSIVLKRAAAEARQGDVNGSMRALEEAMEIAAASRGVDGVYHETSFGPTNIRIHEVHSLLELGDVATALHRAEGFTPPENVPGERRSHHYIDLAAAQLAAGDREGSLVSLQTARKIAPEHTRFHPTVRHTAAALVRMDRGSHDSVSGFARWSGAI